MPTTCRKPSPTTESSTGCWVSVRTVCFACTWPLALQTSDLADFWRFRGKHYGAHQQECGHYVCGPCWEALQNAESASTLPLSGRTRLAADCLLEVLEALPYFEEHTHPKPSSAPAPAAAPAATPVPTVVAKAATPAPPVQPAQPAAHHLLAPISTPAASEVAAATGPGTQLPTSTPAAPAAAAATGLGAQPPAAKGAKKLPPIPVKKMPVPNKYQLPATTGPTGPPATGPTGQIKKVPGKMPPVPGKDATKVPGNVPVRRPLPPDAPATKEVVSAATAPAPVAVPAGGVKSKAQAFAAPAPTAAPEPVKRAPSPTRVQRPVAPAPTAAPGERFYGCVLLVFDSGDRLCELLQQQPVPHQRQQQPEQRSSLVSDVMLCVCVV